MNAGAYFSLFYKFYVIQCILFCCGMKQVKITHFRDVTKVARRPAHKVLL
jgi:hypothetical protein